jgi:hypothetical protein
MFAADDSNLYWSKKDYPESFDPEDYEPIGAEDGQKITGLAAYGDALLIFKTRSVYVLTGKTPISWRVSPLFTDIGCISHRSIVSFADALYWWSEEGPVKWDGNGSPLKIGKLLLGSELTWNRSKSNQIQATVDIINETVLWTYAESGETRNTNILPFSTRLDAFVANKWDPMDVASLATIEDDTGKRWVYFGNYNGQLFRYSDATADGVPSGTVTGTFIAAGTSTATITSSGFYTTGEGLKERMVTVEDSNGQLVARRRITANTGTDLTLASAVTGLTTGATYTFYVGGPNFEWATVLEDSDKPFAQKRYMHIYVKTDNNGGAIGVDVYTDNDADTPKRNLSFTATDGQKTTISERLTVGAVGIEWQSIVRNRAANQDVTLYEVAMRSEVLTDKLG